VADEEQLETKTMPASLQCSVRYKRGTEPLPAVRRIAEPPLDRPPFLNRAHLPGGTRTVNRDQGKQASTRSVRFVTALACVLRLHVSAVARPQVTVLRGRVGLPDESITTEVAFNGDTITCGRCGLRRGGWRETKECLRPVGLTASIGQQTPAANPSAEPHREQHESRRFWSR